MKSLFVLCFVVSLVPSAKGQSLQKFTTLARDAHKSGDVKGFYDNIIEANKIHPYHQGILYQGGVAAALNNKSAEAISFLTKAVYINAEYDLNDNELQSLQ